MSNIKLLLVTSKHLNLLLKLYIHHRLMCEPITSPDSTSMELQLVSAPPAKKMQNVKGQTGVNTVEHFDPRIERISCSYLRKLVHMRALKHQFQAKQKIEQWVIHLAAHRS